MRVKGYFNNILRTYQENEKKAFERVCYNAGIADVTLIPSIICSALGDNLNISTSTGKLIVNIGGGCTNIAALAMKSIITGVCVGIGGSNINMAIEKYILENHGLFVSDGTADRVKFDICSLLENDTASTEVQGVNAETKENQSIVLNSKDLYNLTSYYYGKIAEAISSVISSCPPDIVADINREGIYVFGNHSHFGTSVGTH